jgi:hypothetical protein
MFSRYFLKRDIFPPIFSPRILSGYLRGTAALVIIGLITDFFGTFLTCLGLRSTDPNKKYKYYRVAIYTLIVAGLYLVFDVYFQF